MVTASYAPESATPRRCDYGHCGEQKMLNKIKERFYWPGMCDDVKDWCRAGATCATPKSLAPKAQAIMQTIQAG